MLCIIAFLFGFAGVPNEGHVEFFNVEGLKRQAIVYANPRYSSAAPVVFFFHGHGGNAQYAARRFDIHDLWLEAVVVYMEGLPGVVGITDSEGKRNGWQKEPGQLNDRDVKFFDVALEQIQRQYKTDPQRVYVIGHSNGGRFVNVLWSMRGEKLAAICSASGQGGRLIENAVPKSIFMIAGEKDPLVPFEGQRLSMDVVRRVLQTDSSKAKIQGYERSEPGRNGTELVTYIHPGGHEFPMAALPLVIKFFQRHSRNEVASKS